MFNLMQIKVKIYNCLSYLITFLHIYTGHYDNLITERQGALLILRDKKQNKTQRQNKKRRLRRFPVMACGLVKHVVIF